MADDKKSSVDDGFIRTAAGVREAFDNAKGGISAGAIGGTTTQPQKPVRMHRFASLCLA